MALTFTKYASGVHGDQRYWQGQLTFDSSYPTGGELIEPSDVQMHFVDCICITNDSIGRVGHWDRINGKIRLSSNAGGTQIANGSDESATNLQLLVYGY